jgi:hypothetical protein
MLPDALSRLTVADEKKSSGFTPDGFRHWNNGEDAADGCDTRQEVLIAEAVEAPTVGKDCAITGGKWLSYYDGQSVTSTAALDVVHTVPLAEAWESGAASWTAARRESFANDQQAPASLAAVTSRANRARAAQDPAQWLPSSADQYCRYVAEWTATKLRWQLSVDTDEHEALKTLADGPCEDTAVVYTAAP